MLFEKRILVWNRAITINQMNKYVDALLKGEGICIATIGKYNITIVSMAKKRNKYILINS